MLWPGIENGSWLSVEFEEIINENRSGKSGTCRDPFEKRINKPLVRFIPPHREEFEFEGRRGWANSRELIDLPHNFTSTYGSNRLILRRIKSKFCLYAFWPVIKIFTMNCISILMELYTFHIENQRKVNVYHYLLNVTAKK